MEKLKFKICNYNDKISLISFNQQGEGIYRILGDHPNKNGNPMFSVWKSGKRIAVFDLVFGEAIDFVNQYEQVLRNKRAEKGLFKSKVKGIFDAFLKIQGETQ